MKPGIKKLIAAIVLATIAAVALWYHLMSGTGKVTAPDAPAPIVTVTDTPPSPAPVPINMTIPLDASEVQKSPSFADGIQQARDMKIRVRYEADIPQDSTSWKYIKHYTPPKSSEKYLAVDKDSAAKKQWRVYGSSDYHIFIDEGSHTYEGIPIYIEDQSSKYAITHVGLRINDPELISSLNIEAGVDFNSHADSTDNEQSSRTRSNIVYASLFGPAEAHACGPSHIISIIGTSTMKYLSVENNVLWYELKKPIKLYNISLNSCGDKNDTNKQAAPEENTAAQTPDEEEDDDTYTGDDYYCIPVPDLKSGNLRMHITYVPNDKQGLLMIQLSNLILKDAHGAFYQPEMTGNVTHSYKAYLR